VQLAGVPVSDPDVVELAHLLREAGFLDEAVRLDRALEVETKILALPTDARMSDRPQAAHTRGTPG
jgi:hypothetical protein